MKGNTPDLRPGETADTALGGTVGVIQPRQGYRFGIDPILLARFAAQWPVPLALDLGCGSGVIALCLLALGAARRVVGLDVQSEMVDRARRSARWNGWDDTKACFRSADLRDAAARDVAGPYPLVVANPPYRRVEEGCPSPDPSKAISRTTLMGDLRDWVGYAAAVLDPDGWLCVVLPSKRHGEFARHCREAGLHPLVVRAVRPLPGAEDRFVLCRFGRGTPAPPEVKPPLVLHDPGGRYSQEADRLLGTP